MIYKLKTILEEYSTKESSCYLKLFSDESGRINIENDLEPIFQFENLIMLENWINERTKKLYEETRINQQI